MFNGTKLLSFNEVYLAYKDKFTRFAMFYVSNRQVAEDIVTDSFVAYWEKRIHLPEDTNVPAYILAAVRNKCLTYLRDFHVHSEVLSELKELEEWKVHLKISSLEACDPFEIFTSEMLEVVKSAINSLPLKTRQIFLLSRFQDLSYKEIAEKTGLSVKSVEFHMSKALKYLKQRLQDYYILLFFL